MMFLLIAGCSESTTSTPTVNDPAPADDSIIADDPIADDPVVNDPIEETLTLPEGSAGISSILKDANGNPLTDASVSMYANDINYTDTTDANGSFALIIPVEDLPSTGSAVLTTTKEGYFPLVEEFSMPLVAGTIYTVDSIAVVCPACVASVDSPLQELHHLGDNNYSGSANSQFQKSTDGDEVSIEFSVPANTESITLGFEAKGIQTSLGYDNGVTIVTVTSDPYFELTDVIEDSDSNGFYSSYEFNFELPALSAEQDLELLIYAGESRGDIDDWEFSGVYMSIQ